MVDSNIIRRTTAGAVITALCSAGQGVLAHTTIKEQATEGKTAYNALQIGHGCENPANGKTYPVIAESVVFPTINPIVTRSDGTPTTLEAEVTDSSAHSHDPFIVGLTGKASLVQDRSIFEAQNETYDANGNVIGFYGIKGKLQTNLNGLVPFRFKALTILPTSCAKRVLVKIAIADICKKTFPPKAGTANLWIPANTAKFTDTAIDGIGAPATLTINRDLAAHPLDPACGAGYDVIITPSNEDVDANLPIPGYWPRK
jgi:hypothetical protein